MPGQHHDRGEKIRPDRQLIGGSVRFSGVGSSEHTTPDPSGHHMCR